VKVMSSKIKMLKLVKIADTTFTNTIESFFWK